MKRYREDEKAPLVEVTGLWTNEDKNGKFYLSGCLGRTRILILPNKFKQENPKAPDFKLYVSQSTIKEKE